VSLGWLFFELGLAAGQPGSFSGSTVYGVPVPVLGGPLASSAELAWLGLIRTRELIRVELSMTEFDPACRVRAFFPVLIMYSFGHTN
jgi:hypothetical protein